MLTTDMMSHEEMKRVVNEGYLCARCQGGLSIAWGGAHGFNGYVLRCGNDISHTGVTRHDKKEEQKRREYFSMDSQALKKMTETQMLQRVEMARFPQDLTIADKKLLAQVAITYGFDPLMGEVSIYQGRPYVSIDGRYRKAQETGQLDGVETRPSNKQEKEDWQIPEGDYFYRSEVYVKGSSRPFVAWGRVHKAETVGGKGFKPVEKNPQRMAEKRAEAQALRKAFHIPLPSVEDIGSPDYDIDSTARVIDTSTGEITTTNPGLAPRVIEKEQQSQSREATKSKSGRENDPVNSNVFIETDSPPPQADDGGTEGEEKSPIDSDWLKETLGIIKWSYPTAKSWLKSQFRLLPAMTREDFLKLTFDDVLAQCTPEQVEQFVDHITIMRKAAGREP